MIRSQILAASLLLAVTVTAQDPAKDIRSSEVDKRLDAVEALLKQGDDAAGELLVQALRDKDWEVQERAAAALGQLRYAKAIKKLAELALDGEIARVRNTAADALAEIDGPAAVELLIKKVKSKKTALVTCEALGRIWARTGAGPVDKLQKLLEHKELAVREAAAVAWLAGNAERAQALGELVKHKELVVRAAALELVARAPRPDDAGVLAELLGGTVQDDTIERRILAAATAIVVAADVAERPAVAGRLLDAAEVQPERLARLASRLHRAECLTADAALERVKSALKGDDTGRSAAAKSLGEIGGEAAFEAVQRAFERERSSRVRYQLVSAAARTLGVQNESVANFIALATTDAEPRVRERAIVLLGDREVKGGYESCAQALQDGAWTVVCAAAVSLGKTFEDRAVEPLVRLTKHDDWRRRGAAAVGLMHLNRAAVVEPLIELVGDDVPMVRNAAHYALMRIFTYRSAELDQRAWRDYWAEQKGKFLFRDWRTIEENRKKYGYSVPDREIYDGLDVVVFKSRGDHIENLLEKLEIPYRTTESSKVTEAGLHPEAIFVSNCTGEIVPDDVMPLEWFVHTGGALFGSCWALHETIERVYPGVIEKLPTPRGQVLGDVRAAPCSHDSDYLNGVFPAHVTPIYHLEGAHLIRVVDPERAEVLIDSPDAAQTYGGGNLAAWFRVGHGVILDSVNHFDLQGLEVAPGLKTPEERQVYAIDHMGLGYSEWREIQRKAYWRNATKASKEVPDRSAFRFLTNFVRNKRIHD
ncbi:MAG: HEAT repeat domain-containing protein [Planctomycetes bacterium]|nr:HEAT repeat domain-containing protein [Planctomycetota bacterium]